MLRGWNEQARGVIRYECAATRRAKGAERDPVTSLYLQRGAKQQEQKRHKLQLNHDNKLLPFLPSHPFAPSRLINPSSHTDYHHESLYNPDHNTSTHISGTCNSPCSRKRSIRRVEVDEKVGQRRLGMLLGFLVRRRGSVKRVIQWRMVGSRREEEEEEGVSGSAVGER